VLIGAIREGVALLTWERESFAFADSFDEGEGRYRGLRGGQAVSVMDSDMPGLLVKSEVARRQLDTEKPAAPGPTPPGPGPTSPGPRPGAKPTAAPAPKRFHGSVTLDPTRSGRDASRVADEVITHLSGLVGAQVTVTLEIHAEIPGGAPEQVVRTVTENARTLKFTSQGFETD